MQESDLKRQIWSFPEDYEGPVQVCFLESRFNQGHRPAILYLHGFMDYFFHFHVAQFFNENGYDFFALDLRKYGRSLLPHQRPCFCKSLTEYFPEISKAIAYIHEQFATSVILYGHSTGGLIASLYMNQGLEKQRVDALLLNSPFLTQNMGIGKQYFLNIFTRILSVVWPRFNTSGSISSLFPRSLHKDFEGEWEFDLKWKPILGFPIYPQWFQAILNVQKYLRKKSAISVPILILHSDESSRPTAMEDSVNHSDIVLNVADIRKWGPKLGSRVSRQEIPDAIHDVYLSSLPVRELALEKTLEWLESLA